MSTQEERVLLEEVHDAVYDLAELIKTYQNKNRLTQVLTSTLFKRRQDELNAVIDRAIWGLHVSAVHHIVRHHIQYGLCLDFVASCAKKRCCLSHVWVGMSMLDLGTV